MPYLPHTLVQFGGVLEDAASGLPTEIWECGIRGTTSNIGGALGNPQDYLDKIRDPLADWFASPINGQSNHARLFYIKVNNIRADGRYADQTNTHRYDLVTPRNGGASLTMPNILSLCYSWRTARRRGIGSNGRMYTPNHTYGSPSSMEVSAANTTAAAQAAKRLLLLLSGMDDAVNGPGDLQNFVPVVASAGINNGAGAGVNEPITGVRVGSIYDVQRRRKNALVEVYHYEAKEN